MRTTLHIKEQRQMRSSRCFTRLALVAVSLAGILGCGEKIGTPLPDPLPQLKGLRASGAQPEEVKSHLLVGLHETVVGAGEVRVATSQGDYQALSSEEGSFALDIMAVAGEAVQIRFRRSEPLSFTLPVIECGPNCLPPPPQPQPIDGVEPVTAPVDGETRVRGQLEGPGIELLAINQEASAVAAGRTDSVGQFTLEIAAATGDEILVYRDTSLLINPWVLTVP